MGAATGGAYVYRHDGASWVEEQKLVLAGAEGGERFGAAVAIDGDAILVGADALEVSNVDGAGAVYVFRYDGSFWLLEDSMSASDPNDDAFFGHAVAIDGDVIVVGADTDNILDLDAGAAYVFRNLFGSWFQEQKLNASDGEADDLFGTAVAVEGDVVVVTAVQHDDLGASRGAAYVYRDVGGIWVEEQQLTASDVEPFDRFGQDVSISGDTVLIGSDDDDFGNVSGAAYLYRDTGGFWVEQTKMTATTLGATHSFGSNLAIDGDRALIGSPGDGELGNNAGTVYAFDVSPVTLEIAQESAQAGDTLDVAACGGVPGNPIGFTAVEFAGEPIQRTFDIGTVAPDGTWDTSLLIPENPALPGNDAGFQLVTLDRFGVVVRSNVDSVALE